MRNQAVGAGAGRRRATAPTATSTTCFRRSSRRTCRIGLIGTHPRRDLGGRDVEHRRGAQLAGHGDLIDFYKRHLRPEAPDAHYLTVSRVATGCWGVFACVVALFATNLGSLIEVVNRFGSFFYGSLLGVFMLAIGTTRATGHRRVRRPHRRDVCRGLRSPSAIPTSRFSGTTSSAPSASWWWA